MRGADSSNGLARRLACCCSGQSTLEYALVMFALLASIATLGMLLGFLRRPASFEAAVGGSAHVLSDQNMLGSVQDLAVF